jgi:hypothetical protein
MMRKLYNDMVLQRKLDVKEEKPVQIKGLTSSKENSTTATV